MSDFMRYLTNLPPDQKAIRAKCFHPAGKFIEFTIDESEQTIPALFETQVGIDPDHVAIRTKSHQLSYGQLNKIANRIARTILSQAGEKEEPIALLLGHNAMMIASIIGVMKCGKTCLPLEPASPPARTRHILEDSETALIVTNSDYLAAASCMVNRTIRIINIDELDPRLADDNIGLSIPPDNLAFILYTSGSTGQPKGVTQTHRNALHSTMAYINGLHIQTDDRLTLLGFCSGAQGMKIAISALVTGAALYPWNIAEEGLANLANWLITEGITVYISSATVFRSFITTLKGDEQFPTVRVIRIGNEPVRQADVNLCQKHFSPNCIFVNWFAATETGSVACYFIDNTKNTTEGFVPVGYVFDGTEIHILDDNGRQLGFNQQGEIAIKSRYLSPGYWRQPELTRDKLLPDPNGGDERTFLSGDLGFMLPDGCLYHVGRKDFQVKIRGNRIEVGEVETALLALDAIKDAVVVATDRAGEKCLVAYIVAAETPPPSVATIRGALAENLPGHMIPSVFVLLDAMPLTPNGKIDRRALPEPGEARPALQLAYVAPRTPFEKILTDIWAEIIGVERVGIHDNFFELGGDSLLATRVVSQVLKQFELELPLQSLFHSPTVAEMASVIAGYLGRTLGNEEMSIMLAELESLSDDEAQRVISERVSNAPKFGK